VFLSAAKRFYRVMRDQDTYAFPNPLQDPLRRSPERAEEPLEADDAWPRMPECSGVAPPRPRTRRLSDSFFTLVGATWVPQVVDDLALPARVLAGGRRLPRWRLRDECVTRLLFETGGRVSEVTGLTLGDWLGRGLLQEATAFSKGSHGRRVKFLRFSSDTAKLLRRYVDSERCALDPRSLTCAALLAPAARQHPALLAAPLFLSARRTPLSPKTYRAHAWTPACAAAGLDADVHQARHWYVTMAVRQIYETAPTDAEVRRRLRELIEYMKWRRGEQTLEAYEHYFDGVRHAEIQDRVHARLDEALRAHLAETRSAGGAAPRAAPITPPASDLDEPEWTALRPFVSARGDG
jgi:integrase